MGDMESRAGNRIGSNHFMQGQEKSGQKERGNVVDESKGHQGGEGRLRSLGGRAQHQIGGFKHADTAGCWLSTPVYKEAP